MGKRRDRIVVLTSLYCTTEAVLDMVVDSVLNKNTNSHNISNLCACRQGETLIRLMGLGAPILMQLNEKIRTTSLVGISSPPPPPLPPKTMWI